LLVAAERRKFGAAAELGFDTENDELTETVTGNNGQSLG
jgi:hypothetical protein